MFCTVVVVVVVTGDEDVGVRGGMADGVIEGGEGGQAEHLFVVAGNEHVGVGLRAIDTGGRQMARPKHLQGKREIGR